MELIGTRPRPDEEPSFNTIKFHFPNCYQPPMDRNETKLQESFQKIYETRSPFPARSTIISNDKEIDGVDCILSRIEIERYGKMERRIELLGCNFRIVENRGEGESLFRAVAQALVGSEARPEVVLKKVFQEICEDNFEYYRNDLIRSYIEDIPQLVKLTDQKKIIRIYKKYLSGHKCQAGTMELHAAAIKYKFNFCLVVVWRNTEAVVVNCNDPKLANYPAKHYFLMTGKSRKFWHFEQLIPIGDFIEPIDGKHRLNLKQAITVPEGSKMSTKTFVPTIPDQLYQIVFATNEGEFLFHDTKAHNLFQILSEIFFGDVEHGEAVKEVLDERRAALDYILRPKVVRDHKIIVPGSVKPHTTHAKLQEYRHKAGDITYLKLAASEFGFSTLAIGIDTMGNFYTTRTIYYNQKFVDATGSIPDVPWYYFFVRNAGKETTWHRLHLISTVQNVLKEISYPMKSPISEVSDLEPGTTSRTSNENNYLKPKIKVSNIHEIFEPRIPNLVSNENSYSKPKIKEVSEIHEIRKPGSSIRASNTSSYSKPKIDEGSEILEILEPGTPIRDSNETSYSKPKVKLSSNPKLIQPQPMLDLVLKPSELDLDDLVKTMIKEQPKESLSNKVKRLLSVYKSETMDHIANIKHGVHSSMLAQTLSGQNSSSQLLATNVKDQDIEGNRIRIKSCSYRGSTDAVSGNLVETIYQLSDLKKAGSNQSSSVSEKSSSKCIDSNSLKLEKMSIFKRKSNKVAPMPIEIGSDDHTTEKIVGSEDL